MVFFMKTEVFGNLQVLTFFGNKTFNQRLGANLKKNFFLLNSTPNLLLFLRFPSFIAQKALKMTISTSIWGAQHPSAGRNIQQSNSKKRIKV